MVNIIMFPLISDGLIPNSYLISGKNFNKFRQNVPWYKLGRENLLSTIYKLIGKMLLKFYTSWKNAP